MQQLTFENAGNWSGAGRKLGTISSGKPVDWFVNEQVDAGEWREEEIAPEVTGLKRPIRVYRAPRKTNLITYAWHGDSRTFCPPQWYDLAIGSGACGFGCSFCFLMATHRIFRDPYRHLLYDNVDDFIHTVEKWLGDKTRRRQHTLGVGIDRSDSLLYEGVTGHVRNLAPLFGNSEINKQGNKLVLLTKSANTHYLAEIKPEHRANVVVTFSLNPQAVASAWEGIYPDTGESITPPISKRLESAKFAQDLGFEVRVRIDPILTVEGWQEPYRQFVADVKAQGINFRYWTLGTYREKSHQLDAWRERWGIEAARWQPEPGELEHDGTHWHLPEARRVEIYGEVAGIIRDEWAGEKVRISLCKETHGVRKALRLCNGDCNCLV